MTEKELTANLVFGQVDSSVASASEFLLEEVLFLDVALEGLDEHAPGHSSRFHLFVE